jgi:putative hydrolase of the HAD superfamily
LSNEIRGWILDYGEVLCNRPDRGTIEPMARAAGLDSATFLARYEAERDAYDRGDLSPRDYWGKILAGGAAPNDGLLDRLRQWDVERWSDLNLQMTAWLDALRRAGYKTAVLSNMHCDMAVHVRRSFDWLNRLDCAILSCEVRLLKPEAAIYHRCLEGMGLQPSQACFIDDREVNVRGAREAGLLALRFQGVASLRQDLMDMGISVRPGEKSVAALDGD